MAPSSDGRAAPGRRPGSRATPKTDLRPGKRVAPRPEALADARAEAQAGPAREAEPVDLVTMGRRVRHLRQARGMTLNQLGTAVGRAPSQLSMIENGRREPRLTLLHAIAAALGVPVAELLAAQAPSRRAALEIELEHAQRDPRYAEFGLPQVRPGRRLPSDALEALVGLHRELARVASERVATPEEARRANAQLRRQMRERDNYYAEIESAAAGVLGAVRHATGPLSQRGINEISAHLGFTLCFVSDLPYSTRSVTDLRHRRIYLPQGASGHVPRAVVLQTLGHFVLGHLDPRDFGDFLRQRVEANYFAAALLIPGAFAVDFLTTAKNDRALAIEDLRDVFGVSYETAAHRFTNLATHHLGVRVHFMRTHESGTIYKAYENDGVRFPTDVTGAIEGQPACRKWAARTVFEARDQFSTFYQYTDTPGGTYWCTAHTEQVDAGSFSVNVGVPYADARWFRGRDTPRRTVSSCPEPDCCRRPPPEAAARWQGWAWPSARAHSHLLAALPPGTFPGVDVPDVYRFLQTNAPATDGPGG
jgi:predicted transcriptional regulator/DNA-binding XRE family transcriptional regulator